MVLCYQQKKHLLLTLQPFATGDNTNACNFRRCMPIVKVDCTLQKQMCYFSKVFGCYNCVTISLLCNFMNAVIIKKKRIHAMGADT